MVAVAGRLLRLLAALAALAIAAIGLLATGAAIIVLPTLAAQLTGRVTIETVQQGQITRQYRVYRPAAVEARPGLVIVLHGADGSGLQIERQSGFDAQANRLRWIAVYPDGFSPHWQPWGAAYRLPCRSGGCRSPVSWRWRCWRWSWERWPSRSHAGADRDARICQS